MTVQSRPIPQTFSDEGIAALGVERQRRAAIMALIEAVWAYIGNPADVNRGVLERAAQAVEARECRSGPPDG